MGEPASPAPAHLCVFVHGLWGKPAHLNFLRETLQSQYPDDNLKILVPKSNADYNTYDGIEVGAERITHEIEQTIIDLEEEGSTVKKISIIGYSLGGLVSRYAVGLLYKNGLFEDVAPINFVTFATPHLGVRTPKLGYRNFLRNVVGARTLSTSGQQMFMIDKFRDTGRPLLSIMTDHNSIFVKGLRMFKRRSLYANTINDRSVPYYTAGISRTDPFVDLDKVDLNYIPGQDDPVILDPLNPVSLRKSKPDPQTTYERLFSKQTRTALPFYVIFFLLLPIALPTFLVNAAIQTYKSTQRVKLHESGKAGISPARYRIPLIEQAQAVQDQLYSKMAAQAGEEYLPTPPPEPATSATHSEGSSSEEDLRRLARTESAKENSPFPILALTEDQFEMIEDLDELGFEKFLVHIQRHRHTHAAIVVRMQKEGFEEGKVVVRHWVERFEV